MKILGGLVLLAIIGCNQVESGLNTLNATELANIAARQTAQCQAANANDFKNIKATSDDQFNNGSDNYFTRNRAWKWERKNGSSTLKSEEIIVWKVLTNAVVFIATQTDSTGESTNPTMYYFIKVLSSENDTMIDELRTLACSTNKNNYATYSGNNVTVKKVVTTDTGDNLNSQVTSTYTLNLNYLAYLGTFSSTVATKNVDDNGTVVTGTNAYSQTITTTLTEPYTKEPAQTTYTDYTPALTQYCTMTTSFPFTRTCTSTPFAASDLEL